MIQYKLYTGPCAVWELAARLREAQYAGVFEGTEHVYFTSPEPVTPERLSRALRYKPDEGRTGLMQIHPPQLRSS